MTLCCIVYLNTEKTGPLLLAWHHLNSDFQSYWNLAKYLVFFVAGALGDSIRFGIFVVYQFHSGTIFASQGLRSALLIFTLGIARRIFVIPAHCHLLDFESYAPCNDVIFSQSMRGFHLLSFECPENWLEIIIGSVSSYKLLYSVAANRTNFFILSKSCRTDDFPDMAYNLSTPDFF